MKFKLLIILMTFTVCSSCKAQAGGKCEYNEIKGVAHIISADSVQNSGNNYIDVRFNFVPDKSNDTSAYRFSTPDKNQSITVGDGRLLTVDEFKKLKININDSLDCLRKELVKGVCTPVIFEINKVREIIN